MGYAIVSEFAKNMDANTRFHRFRYHLAKGFVDVGDVVIDYGCGTAYGTDILSETALRVIGIDSSQANIDYARLTHPKDNIDYVCANIETLDIPECDVAVQFENLEHLYDPKSFVDKLKKSVGKYIIMSVPFGCEKLIKVGDDIQADLDSEHHSVFNTPDDVKRLFVDENWKEFWSMTSGVTFIGIFYKI